MLSTSPIKGTGNKFLKLLQEHGLSAPDRSDWSNLQSTVRFYRAQPSSLAGPQ
jgi:hypothetical protein